MPSLREQAHSSERLPLGYYWFHIETYFCGEGRCATQSRIVLFCFRCSLVYEYSEINV